MADSKENSQKRIVYDPEICSSERFEKETGVCLSTTYIKCNLATSVIEKPEIQKMEKTVFVVCIKEGNHDDFLYICETEEKAIERKTTYEKAFSGNESFSLVIFEEVLYS